MKTTKLHAIPNGDYAASEEVLRDYAQALRDHDTVAQLGIVTALLRMSVAEIDTPVRGHARATARVVCEMRQGWWK